MSLIKCKECGNEVSSKAETCPKCGVRIARKPIGCGAAIALMFLFVVIGMSVKSIFLPDTSVAPPATSEEKAAARRQIAADDAKYACREFMKERLKAPATAKFPYYKDFVSRPNGPDEFEISSYVDAQNAYGAMIRISFDCTVRKDAAGTWRLLAIYSN